MLRQADQLWPNRSRASDGTIGDPAHSARSSDHNPDDQGWVRAVDLTHDPENGPDAHAWVREVAARRDPRVKYLISNQEIWNPGVSMEWRAYTGPNPHTRHVHLSIKPTDAALYDASPWFFTTIAPRQEIDLTPSESQMLADIATELGKLAVVIRDPNNGIDVRLARLAAQVESLAVGDGDVEATANRLADLLAQRLAS